jgi:hypothetical protein
MGDSSVVKSSSASDKKIRRRGVLIRRFWRLMHPSGNVWLCNNWLIDRDPDESRR